MDNELIIGSHVSFKKDTQLMGSVEEAISYNANTFMFYTGAPQNTSRVEINDMLTLKGYEMMKKNNIKLENVIVHAPYIVNLANKSNYDFSVSFLKDELERCNQLGIRYMVLHPGSATNTTRRDAIDDIARGLKKILENDNEVMILLETMAGKGNEIGKTFEELKEIIDKTNNKKLGICLDTCHLSDSGYNIKQFDKLLQEFDTIIGIDKIKCIHINDSKNDIGTHKDRHENIGYGYIGYDTLINIIYHPLLKKVPKVLETPYVCKEEGGKEKIYPPYKYEIQMIRNKKFNNNLYKDIREYYK